MRVHLEKTKCTGHAQCNAVDPDLFPLDDLGYSVLEPRDVPPDQQDRTRAGAAACPEGALIVDEQA